jgi:gamma-glutamylcyclotransferase (GGCT)/AIG2-like uncharacterized protein YtfP
MNKNIKKHTPIFYIAYGSNMWKQQMEMRCPDAQLITTGEIDGYRLLFKGSLTGSYATIEPEDGHKVPVYIWAITADDERALDRYEGFPTFYYKTNIPVKLHKDGRIVHGMVYIMHEERHLGIPSGKYFNNIRAIYESHKWDTEILWDALDKSTDHIKSEAKKH